MGTYNFTWLNWITGWYATQARIMSMMDNDGYLRERTDFCNMPLGNIGTVSASNPSSTWGVRLTMDGAVISSWTHDGASAPHSKVNLDISAVAEGSTLVKVEVGLSGGSGTWYTLAEFRIWKKQDHAYASFWITLVSSQAYITGSAGSLVTHRESKTW